MDETERAGGAMPLPIWEEPIYDYEDKRYSGLLDEE